MLGTCLTSFGGSDNPWVAESFSDLYSYLTAKYNGQFVKYTGVDSGNIRKNDIFEVIPNTFTVGDMINYIYYPFSNKDVTQDTLKRMYEDIASVGTTTNTSGRWYTYFYDDYLVQRNYTLFETTGGKKLVITWLYGQEGSATDATKHDEYYLGYGTEEIYKSEPKNSSVVIVDGVDKTNVNNTDILDTVTFINTNDDIFNWIYKNSTYAYELAPYYKLIELTNKATDSDIIPGKEAYDSFGEKLTGTLKSYNNPFKPETQDDYNSLIADSDVVGSYIEFNNKTTSPRLGGYNGVFTVGDTLGDIYFDTSKTPEFPTDWSTYDYTLDIGSTEPIKFKTLMRSDDMSDLGIPKGLFLGYGPIADDLTAYFIIESSLGRFAYISADSDDFEIGWQKTDGLRGDNKDCISISSDNSYTITTVSDNYNWNGVYTFKNGATKEVVSYYPLDELTNTAAASEILKDKEAYDDEGNKIIGTFELKLQEKTATPGTNPQNILPDSGYTGLSKVSISGVGITAKKSVTPGTADINLIPDTGDLGIAAVDVAGDTNLIAGNIKKDVSIFGVVGTLEGTDDPDAGKLKLGKPLSFINWDTDEYVLLHNPYTSGEVKLDGLVSIDDADPVRLTGQDQTSNYTITFRGSEFVRKLGGAVGAYGSLVTDLNLEPGKEYKLKGMSKFKEYLNHQIKVGDEVFYDIKPIGYIDSDYSDEVIYSRYNYTNTIENLGVIGETSGTLNNHKYNTGTLLTYNPSINYIFDLDPSGNGTTNYDSYYQILKMQTRDFSLISNGYNYSSSFAKVSFTLSEATEVKVKYQITKSTSSSASIIIAPMDKNYTSFSYGSGFADAVVNYNTTTDFDEKEYSFGTLEAGEHFYFVQFYNYASVNNNWQGIITPVFEEISTGKYFPPDISVINSNEAIATYTYNPYTGNFSIPMTGTITMKAVGADQEALEELIITPSTWNVHTSILTWDYALDGVTYNIQTPDGQTYTTTEKQFDFTGKLGDASSNYKTIKIWASQPTNASGKTIINLIYNPNNEFFNKYYTEDTTITNANKSFAFNYKNDAYILNGRR